MNFEILISTMHKDTNQVSEMLASMNISCDAIVIVQGDFEGTDELELKAGKAKIFYTKERGLSKSRNMALINSNADIVLLSDDDLYYYDNFNKKILDSFNKNNGFDFIIFNLDNYNKTYPEKKKKVFFHNILGFSSCQIAFKRQAVLDKGIFFNEDFGTGSGIYSSGEENIFLAQCYKYFKMLYVPEKILKRTESDSSWFTGYNEKYLFDRGAIFYTISNKIVWLLILQFAVRRKKLFPDYSFYKIVKLMVDGYLDSKRRLK